MDLPPENSRHSIIKSEDSHVEESSTSVSSSIKDKTLVNHSKVKTRGKIKRKLNNDSEVYVRNKRTKKLNLDNEQDPNGEKRRRISSPKITQEDVEQIMRVFISMISEYLEIIKPEVLVDMIILQNPKLREPFIRVLKIIMNCILSKDNLAVSLTEAINALGDSNVRNSLKYTKRELMQRSTMNNVKKVKVKVKNWGEVIVEELERQNLL